MDDEQWTRWKKKRKHSFMGFVLVGTVIGIDYSFMFSTLYLYLKDVVKTDNPNFFYGLIISLYCISSAISGLILGRFADKSRKIKLLTNLVLILQIIGIILYVIPINIAFPIFGRLISGIGDPYTSICAGEVVRSYGNDGTSHLWWLASSYSIGFMIGPSLVGFFKNVKFQIGTIYFNQLNSVGILIGILLIISLFVANLTVHDCSYIFDLKSHLNADRSTDNTEDPSPSNDLDQSPSGSGDTAQIASPCHTPSLSAVVTALSRNYDCILLYGATLVFVYSWFAVDVLMPLLQANILKWSLKALTITFAVNGVLYLLMTIISSKLFVTDKAIFYFLIFSTISLLSSYVIILLFVRFRENLVPCIILMVFFVILWATGVQEVLIRCTLAKMVPSSCQSFAEAIRNFLSRLSMIIAALTVPLCSNYLKEFSTSVIIVSGVLLFAFIIRRKTFLQVCEIDIVKSPEVTENVITTTTTTAV